MTAQLTIDQVPEQTARIARRRADRNPDAQVVDAPISFRDAPVGCEIRTEYGRGAKVADDTLRLPNGMRFNVRGTMGCIVQVAL